MSADHIGITSPDDRGRIPLRRFLRRKEGAQYRVYIENDGRRIILEEVDS
jgi:hypothetical protein